MGINRRDLLKSLATLPVLGAFGFIFNWDYNIYKNEKARKEKFISNLNINPKYPPEPLPLKGDPIKVGIIGTGTRGTQLLKALGFMHPETLESWKKHQPDRYQEFMEQEKLNIKVTAICDLFDYQANRAIEAVGHHDEKPRRYKTYQDLLDKSGVDAVVIATADLWHAPIAIAAAKAGKHIYIEKPLTHKVNELYELRKVVNNTGITFQLGHQHRQHQSNYTTRDLLNKNVIGHMNLIQTTTNRNSDNGAWQYSMYPDQPDSSINWKQYINGYYDIPLNREYFFRWRKYWKFGSGLTGDLLTHEYDRLNFITGMGIPESVNASGGIYTHRDGRNVPDVMQVGMEFPEYFKATNQERGKVKGMSFFYSASLGNQYKRETLLMGHDGTIKLGNDLALWIDENSTRYQKELEKGIISPDTPIVGLTGKNGKIDASTSATAQYFANKGLLYDYREGKRVDITHLHMKEWFSCIGSGKKPSCPIDVSFEEAITAIMATLAYKTGKKVTWDKSKEKIIIPDLSNPDLDEILIA